MKKNRFIAGAIALVLAAGIGLVGAAPANAAPLAGCKSEFGALVTYRLTPSRNAVKCISTFAGSLNNVVRIQTNIIGKVVKLSGATFEIPPHSVKIYGGLELTSMNNW
ncbi:hypothetical protein [Microbacterium tumbae]